MQLCPSTHAARTCSFAPTSVASVLIVASFTSLSKCSTPARAREGEGKGQGLGVGAAACL